MILDTPAPAEPLLDPADARARRHGKILGEYESEIVHCVEVLYPPGLECEEHAHDRPTISICFSGGVAEIVSGIRFSLSSSSVYTRPAGARHSNSFGADHLRGLVIELKDEFLKRYPSVRDLVRYPTVFHGAAILATATSLSSEVRKEPSDSIPVRVDALVLTLVSQLLKKGEGASVSPTTAWVNELVLYLKRNFGEHLTVNGIAREFRLHPSYLGRVFKRELQLSVMEYLRKLRVEHAAQLLATTEMPLSEISDVCAFADQAHFTRVFKSVVGATPRAYRRMASEPADPSPDA